MSLIHEALEKMEQDKGVKSKPVLRPVSVESLKQKDRPENLWAAYGIIGVLLLSLILGLIYFFTHPSEPVRPTERSARLRSMDRPLRALPPASPLFGLQRFTLTGITQMGNERTAIINNMLVREGDQIDNAKIREIKEDGVILNIDGQILRLSLYAKESAHLTHLEPSQ